MKCVRPNVVGPKAHKYCLQFYPFLLFVIFALGIVYSTAMFYYIFNNIWDVEEYKENPLLTDIHLIHYAVLPIIVLILNTLGCLIFRTCNIQITIKVLFYHVIVEGIVVGLLYGSVLLLYEEKDTEHFVTIHGKIGVVLIAALIANFILGLSLLALNSITFVALVHGFFGLVTIILSGWASVTGMIQLSFEEKLQQQLGFGNDTIPIKMSLIISSCMTMSTLDAFYMLLNPYFEWEGWS